MQGRGGQPGQKGRACLFIGILQLRNPTDGFGGDLLESLGSRRDIH